MSSLALSDAVLAAASAFAVFLLCQQQAFAQIHRTATKGALLGFLLIALAAVAGTLKFGFSDIWTDVYLFLNNAATYLSPPLIGTAIALLLSNREWSKPAWGRMILGLCLAYEITRWYGVETLYRDALLAISLLIALYRVLKAQVESGPKGLLLIAFISFFIGGLVIGNEGTLGGYLRVNLFRYMIALGSLLLGTGLFMLLKNQNKMTEQAGTNQE
ncbi:hypothetical protein [Endozoicomonas numazuensis]|uniref:Uncharacterized protein n=1 Tax=Endozoicomonas numazuensis TaxID=1137799 RepID=A0A081NEI3_9GAMM|nr:hypothetical protein [Endozoicomonas numazuensis]KEQ16856.1 hypothetical protein GZ78_19530 [Endozoicomonas numazuensis]